MNTDAIAGAILGCAVGDALGLPYEGLSPRRAARLLGEPDRHRLLFGRGMVSDDTEHTCMVAQALCEAPRDADAFARALARRMRWWLLGLPAGAGLSTARAALKLWVGFPPHRSGVYSAGNGPAMRSAILGAAVDDLAELRRLVRVSTRLTHTDSRAEEGAFAVALAAWCARQGIGTARGFLETHESEVRADGGGELSALLARVAASVEGGHPTTQFAFALGCGRGISGYILHTVPVALHAWLSHPRDYRSAIVDAIRCGGDADTTAAIVGAIVGSGVGRAGIPAEWLEGLLAWPRRVAWMLRLAEATGHARTTGSPAPAPPLVPGATLARNLLFLAVVLGHGFRRLLPPYATSPWI